MINGPAVRVLALAGSTREGSFNKVVARKLLAQTVMHHTQAQSAGSGSQESMAEDEFEKPAGRPRRFRLQGRYIDLRNYSLPLFDADLESEKGLPEEAAMLRSLFAQSDALIIASPEYNGSFSGVLKNTIDWLSRTHPDHTKEEIFGKIVLLASASTSRCGASQGLTYLRILLSRLGAQVLPFEFSLPRADQVIQKNILPPGPDRRKLNDVAGKFYESCVRWHLRDSEHNMIL